MEISLSELCDVTGWATSSARTYVSKKWSRLLTPLSSGRYRVHSMASLSWEDFQRIQTQSNRELQVPELNALEAPASLAAVKLQNFKSFADATLPLASLTVLIGANAAGKSNFIEGMQLLSWTASGRPVSDIWYAVQQSELELRGSLPGLRRDKGHPLGLGCLITEHGDTAPRLELMSFFEDVEENMRLKDETLIIPGNGGEERLYDAFSSGRAGFIEVFVDGESSPLVCINQQPIFTQFTSPAQIEGKTAVLESCSRVRHALSSVLFLDPNPRRMRQYSFKADSKKLKGDASNAASILYPLCRAHGPENRKDRVLEFIRALPEQDVQDIGFVETRTGEVMIELTESFGASPVEAARLSDGTLRVLAITAALLSATRGSTVVIEEIDNGIHPSRAKLLLDNIERAALDHDLRVLLTTHSPALLDAIPVRAIPNIVVCYRDPAHGDSRLVRLEDIEDYPELVAQGSIGHLVTAGIMDKFLKNRPSHQEKKERAMAWLDAIKREA